MNRIFIKVVSQIICLRFFNGYLFMVLLGEICHQYFCNIYFQKCQRQDCLGCLNQLRSIDLFDFIENFCFLN